MKLIFCPACEDVVKMLREARTCRCGASWGRYLDERAARYGGRAIPLGFVNLDLVEAIRAQPTTGLGSRFTAFVIPKSDAWTQQENKTATRRDRTHRLAV